METNVNNVIRMNGEESVPDEVDENRTNNIIYNEEHNCNKDENIDKTQMSIESSQDDNMEGSESKPTDEFGRELSEYEIMRLERIRRNQEYLEQLGLEESKKQRRQMKQDRIEQLRIERERKKSENVIARRERISRKSKEKEVNYVIDFVGDGKSKKSSINNNDTEKSNRSKKDSVPLFIYKELRQKEVNRRHNLKNAEKDLRAAETEYRHAEKQLKIHIRKEQRLKDQKARQLSMQKLEREKAIFQPVIDELDKRQWELKAACMEIDEELKSRDIDPLYSRKDWLKMVDNAKEKLPYLMNNKLEKLLDNLLIDRHLLCSSEQTAPGKRKNGEKLEDEPASKRKKDGKNTMKESIGIDSSEQIKTCTDIGGPITANFSKTLERSWLEEDSPSVPTATSSYFVPQVGDFILYYPSAHYNFLEEHPEIRIDKRHANRKPLWELMSSQHASSQNINLCWDRWIKAVELGEASYPLLCRVQKTTSEFPSDTTQHSSSKSKSRESTKMGQRRKHVYLNVLLKPLTPLYPPRVSPNCNDSFFHEDSYIIPSSFSVILFPSNHPQFIVPFVWAYSTSISLSIGDHVRTTSSKSIYQVVGKNNEYDDTHDTSINDLELFRRIIQSDMCADIDCTFKIHRFIEDFYLDSNYEITLPEDCLRILLQDIITTYRSKILNQESSPDSSQTVLSDKTKKCLSNIFSWIRLTLPRWGGIKLLSGKDREELYISAWNLIPIDSQGQDKINNIMNKPSSLQLSPFSSCIGGLIYSFNESVRANIESCIKQFISESSQIGVQDFMADVSEILAPGYRRYVPTLMSLNRVLRRLELRKLTVQASSMSSTSYRTLENISCCYYRSIDAICSDLSVIYRNCFLYNHPESDIVKKSFDIISLLSPLITKMEDQEQSKWKQKVILKRKELQHLEQISLGKDSVSKLKKQTKLIPGFNPKLLHSRFESELSREWISSIDPDNSFPSEENISSSDEDMSAKFWIPQTGDSILYFPHLHGKFIYGHYPDLSKEERILPTVHIHLPNIGTKGIIGSIKYSHPIFPSRSVMETFDVNSPLLEVGIEFHYDNLVGRTLLVHWRPCYVLETAKNITSCKHCGLCNTLSFITPAWIPQEKKHIVPPQRAILPHDPKIPPTGFNQKHLKILSKCFDVLRQRCLDGATIDAFGIPNPPILQDDLLVPPHLLYMFDESNPNSIDMKSDDSKSAVQLAEMCFIAPWEQLNKSDYFVEGNNLHQILLPYPSLCLDLILKRIQNGHYRHTLGIAGDIREAFFSVVSFILKKHFLLTNNKNACKNILFEVVRRSADQMNIQWQEMSDVPLSTLKKKDLAVVQRLMSIKKLYAMALGCVLETPTFLIALGIEAEHEFDENQLLQLRAKSYCEEMLDAVKHETNKAYKTLPSVKVKLNFYGGFEENTDCHERVLCTLNPMDYIDNDNLVSALLCQQGRKQACARCKIHRFSVMSCRMIKKHSNPDFTFIDYFKESGGVDGLLKQLKQPNAHSSFGNQDTPAEISDSAESFTTLNQDVRNINIAECSQRSACNNEDDSENIVESVDIQEGLDLQLLYDMAEEALDLAKDALNLARKDMDSKLILSEDFLKSNFIVDPDDGHYEICMVCGLGGDIICCDSCPNACHPKCAGYDVVPDDDFHCYSCEKNDEETSNFNVRSSSSLFDLLNMLKSARLKDKPSHDDQVGVLKDNDDEQEGEQKDNPSDDDQEGVLKDKPGDYNQEGVICNSKIAVGTKLMKNFDSIFYEGEVKSIPTTDGDYYYIQYADGDEEDMSEDELVACIEKYLQVRKHSQNSEANENIKRPRGRPRKSNNYTPEHNRKQTIKAKDRFVIDEIKRPRGRPRKSYTPEHNRKQTVKANEKFVSDETSKRPRGRPRMSYTPEHNRK